MNTGSRRVVATPPHAVAPADRTPISTAQTVVDDIRPAVSPIELRRQQAVIDSGLLDTPRESRFDIIVEMARDLVGTPSAAFSLIDGYRSWRKSRIEVADQEISRTHSLCSAALEYAAADDAAAAKGLIAFSAAANARRPPARMLVVTDARTDDRFSSNPNVLSRPGIVTYLGLPIRDANGERIGVLCVFDIEPRIVTALTLVLLTELGALLEVEVQRTVPRILQLTQSGTDAPRDAITG